ncbi:B3 domain-containing protein [Trifolium pratense]|uniref:B3 domain-containing protein n=1 Tax=Trifolium pratense TaxID=57577 RepID=A0A2K3L737_TRIPR|nr:B3 domain-containing protein [Trifolium pratense]
MEKKDFTTKLLGFVGNECVVLESLLLLNDPLYGALHSKNNVPIPVSDGCNVQAFREIVAMKKVRSGRSKRIDCNILSSKFKVTSCTSNNEDVEKIIVKEKTSEGIKNIKKRKAMGEGSKNSSKKFKNREKEEVQEDQPDLPLVFKEKIEQLEGNEVQLVIQKELTMTDVKKNNGRLSVPIGKMKIEENSLLTQEEGLSLDYVPQKKGTSRKLEGMSVSMLDTNLKLWDNMCFKKWKMGESEVYNITGEWYNLAVENHLQQHQKIQLWSFKRNNHLNFALVKL